MVAKKKPKRSLSYTCTAYLYLLPAFLLMAAFIVYPALNTILTSFKYGYKFLTGDFMRFSVEHYKEIFQDPVFLRACKNTLFMGFVCVPCSMLLSLAVALLLNASKRFQELLATLYYLPQVTNVIAAGFVFALIFNNNYGLLNTVLGWFGIEPVAWITGRGIAGDPALYTQSYLRCLFILFCYSMWNGLSLKVILFLGGLKGINQQYYQAAQLDGTSRWKVLSKITLPLLSPTILYVYITSSITAFKAYTAVVALFGNEFGPAGDNSKMMITLVGYIIDKLGSYIDTGAVSMASAAAVILLAAIMVLTGVQMKLTERRVHY